jgi:transposase-like protein
MFSPTIFWYIIIPTKGDKFMGNILHANAKTTPRIRAEIQNSEASIAQLAKHYNLNPKTISRWKNANYVVDKKSGPKVRKSVLSTVEQQAICEIRRQLQLPLDDIFIVLKPGIPALTRSNLHRCLKHFGLSRLPKDPVNSSAAGKKPFKSYPIGYLHVDITELRTDEGKQYLFVAIDRITKYVYIELYQRMTQDNAVLFLRNLAKDCVFKITHILTDNGAQFTYNLLAKHLKPKDRRIHPFDKLCQKLGIEHRTTQFRHPWTNGQVEITNKIIKQATTKRFHYESFTQLKGHLMTFMLYYNHQLKLKSLKFKTPWELIEQCYNNDPQFFSENPNQKIVGLNN